MTLPYRLAASNGREFDKKNFTLKTDMRDC